MSLYYQSDRVVMGQPESGHYDAVVKLEVQIMQMRLIYCMIVISTYVDDNICTKSPPPSMIRSTYCCIDRYLGGLACSAAA